MLPKKQRLTAAEVREILSTGRSARAGSLSAKYIKGTSAAAVVVNSKVAKKAVTRNRLRRAAYAALRSTLPREVRAVFFLHKPELNQTELTKLCSQLS